MITSILLFLIGGFLLVGGLITGNEHEDLMAAILICTSIILNHIDDLKRVERVK